MQQQKGLSLVELMISITLGLILMTGVVQMFLSSKTTFSAQQGISRVQETGRLAIDFIAKDVRMAGFVGMGSRSQVPATLKTTAVPTLFNKFDDAVEVLAAPQAGVNALANSDILIVRGGFTSNPAQVTNGLTFAANADPTKLGKGTFTVKLVSEEVDGCGIGINRFNGICLSDTLVASDYYKSVVFTPSAITKLSANRVSINYEGNWGGDNPYNPNEFFEVGASVAAVSNVIYFIGSGTSGRPSLFQQINGNAALEMLEGVSDMSITFSRKNTPTNYAPAAGALAGLWNNSNPVVSLRIELLTESIDNNVVEDPQIYTFAGQQITGTPDTVIPQDTKDRHLHQVFTTTVALRNQIN